MLFEEIELAPFPSLWGGEASGGPSSPPYSSKTPPPHHYGIGIGSKSIKRAPSVSFTVPRVSVPLSCRSGSSSKRCRHPLPSPLPLPAPLPLPQELHATIAFFLDVPSALAVSAAAPSLTLLYSKSIGAVRLCCPQASMCEPYAPPPLSRLSGLSHLFIDGPAPLLRLPLLPKGQGPSGLRTLELRGMGLLGARGGGRAGDEARALAYLLYPSTHPQCLTHLLLHLGHSGNGSGSVSPLLHRLIRALLPSLKTLHTTTTTLLPQPPLAPLVISHPTPSDKEEEEEEEEEEGTSPRPFPLSLSLPPHPPLSPCYGDGEEGPSSSSEGPLGLEEVSLCLHSSLTPLLLPPSEAMPPSLSPSLLSFLLPVSLRRVCVCGGLGEGGEGHDYTTELAMTHHLLAAMLQQSKAMMGLTAMSLSLRGLVEVELRGLAWDGAGWEMLGTWLKGSNGSGLPNLEVLRLGDGALLRGEEGEGEGHWRQGSWGALRVLELSNNMLGWGAKSGAREVGNAIAQGRMPALTSLDLSWNEEEGGEGEGCVLTELCAGAGAGLRALCSGSEKGAGRLTMVGSGVSVAGMQALTHCLSSPSSPSPSSACPALLCLDVGHNPLLGEGHWSLPLPLPCAVGVGAMGVGVGLVALDLSHCTLQDAQLPHIFRTGDTADKGPHVLGAVQDLRLCGNGGLSDEGLCEGLMGALGTHWGTQLRHLGLRGTGAGTHCARALRRALQGGRCEALVEVDYVEENEGEEEGQWDQRVVYSLLLHRTLGTMPPTHVLTGATEEWVTWLDMN